MDFSWIKEYAPFIGIALSPLLVWVIRQLARPMHYFADHYLDDGELKDILIDENYEEKKAADPERYKRLRSLKRK